MLFVDMSQVGPSKIWNQWEYHGLQTVRVLLLITTISLLADWQRWRVLRKSTRQPYPEEWDPNGERHWVHR